MNEKEISNLKHEYAKICDTYLRAFCDNYDLSLDSDAWTGETPGTIAMVGDFFFSFDTIKYCVDNDLKDYSELISWYDYCMDCGYLGLDMVNFPSWHKGCPRVSTEKVHKLLAMKGDLEKEIEAITGRQKQVHLF